MMVHLPQGLDEAFDLLAHEPEAMLMTGGTDLLPRLEHGAARPPALICLERVGQLRVLEKKDGQAFIGAAVTHAEALAWPPIGRDYPALATALGQLGSPQVRAMGSIGGNLCTASPAGDSLPPLHVLGAQVELGSASGRRRLPVERFIVGPGRTALAPGEILLGVWLPKPPAGALQHFEKVGQRGALAIAVVSLAALLELDGGLVRAARLAWGSVGPTVVRSAAVEQALIGQPLDAATLGRAAKLAAEAVSPIDDARATAAYRRQVAGNLLLRLSLLA